MYLIRSIVCWWRNHQWGEEFRSLYTDYNRLHKRCLRCGAEMSQESIICGIEEVGESDGSVSRILRGI